MFFSFYVTEDYYPGRFETKQALRLIDACITQIQANPPPSKSPITPPKSNASTPPAKSPRSWILKAASTWMATGRDARYLPPGAPLHAIIRAQLAKQLRRLLLLAGAFKGNGLNDRGRAWIHEANRLGMVINVSHASDDAISQAIDASTDPVIATHHGLRQVNDIPRNMPDWLLKKLASKGGVIGFQIGNEFHNRKVFDWVTAHAGKPFWDTKAIHDRAPMTIFEIDQIAGKGSQWQAPPRPTTCRS